MVQALFPCGTEPLEAGVGTLEKWPGLCRVQRRTNADIVRVG